MKASAKKAKQKPKISQHNITNRRASYDYALSDKLVVGIELTGAKTKAARMGHASLRGAYVVPKLNRRTNQPELFLINASFTVQNNAPRGSGQSRTTVNSDACRLLAKRREITKLVEMKSSGMTIVPTRLLVGGRFVKLEIAMGRGKKNYDKRESIKRRDNAREYAKTIKGYRI